MDLTSWLIYNLILFLSVSFAFLSKRTKHKKVFIVFSYLSIVIFCSIRYDVGWDYLGYAESFGFIKYYGFYYFEFGYIILNKLFAFSPIGYIGVFAVMSALTYYFLFKAFLKENILSAGLFFMFTFQFVFMANGQIRQGLAIAIFIYTLKFIENNQYFKYILSIITISLLVHTSAIFLLGAIFISKINLKYYNWIILILISYFLYLRGVFTNIVSSILPYVPFYSRFLNNFRAEAEPTTHYLIVTFWVLVSILIALCAKYIKREKITNIYLFGSVLFPAFVDFHIFARFGFYLTFVNIILLGIIVKNNKYWGTMFIVVAYLLFTIYCLNNWGLSGGYPYKSIFFENLNRY
jgi:hypothetical protein